MRWFAYDSRDEMVKALRSATTEVLVAALSKKGRASWAVSGGGTPAPLFAIMQHVLLDWTHVQIALVDERWVAPDHPRSNEAFMKNSLCKGSAAKARYIGMKTPHASPFDAEKAVNERYAAISQPFDSILLGMGLDGHTASFFPSAEGLERALNPKISETCVALRAIKSDVTGDETDRMSLSAQAIMASPHVVMMITGAEKKKILEQALEAGSTLPVGRLARLKPFDIYWAH